MFHSSGRTMSSVCHGVLDVPQFRQNIVISVLWSVKCSTVQAEQCHQCVIESWCVEGLQMSFSSG